MDTNNDKRVRTIKLFSFLPLYGWVQLPTQKVWKIFGIPFLCRQVRANGRIHKYYLLGLPLMKVSKKLA